MEFSEDSNQIILNKNQLDPILFKPEVRDKQLMVVSIVGPTSSGKTSFENYCLRYIESEDDYDDWMGDDDDPLIGLDWKPTHR